MTDDMMTKRRRHRGGVLEGFRNRKSPKPETKAVAGPLRRRAPKAVDSPPSLRIIGDSPSLEREFAEKERRRGISQRPMWRGRIRRLRKGIGIRRRWPLIVDPCRGLEALPPPCDIPATRSKSEAEKSNRAESNPHKMDADTGLRAPGSLRSGLTRSGRQNKRRDSRSAVAAFPRDECEDDRGDDRGKSDVRKIFLAFGVLVRFKSPMPFDVWYSSQPNRDAPDLGLSGQGVMWA